MRKLIFLTLALQGCMPLTPERIEQAESYIHKAESDAIVVEEIVLGIPIEEKK